MEAKFIFRKRDWVLIAILSAVFFVLDTALFFKQDPVIPVEGADTSDWNRESFWSEPWGISGVHKGIDIFARKGTPALAAVSGLVVYQGQLPLGGNTLTILDPNWRLHYYAHLDRVSVGAGDWVNRGERVGAVGNTGNARGKPAHLHYEVMNLFPNPNRKSERTQGWKLMFYLDPDKYLRKLS